MKVDNPQFISLDESVTCMECPFCDENGAFHEGVSHLCLGDNCIPCPTAETYAEACELAEREVTK